MLFLLSSQKASSSKAQKLNLLVGSKKIVVFSVILLRNNPRWLLYWYWPEHLSWKWQCWICRSWVKIMVSRRNLLRIQSKSITTCLWATKLNMSSHGVKSWFNLFLRVDEVSGDFLTFSKANKIMVCFGASYSQEHLVRASWEVRERVVFYAVSCWKSGFFQFLVVYWCLSFLFTYSLRHSMSWMSSLWKAKEYACMNFCCLNFFSFFVYENWKIHLQRLRMQKYVLEFELEGQTDPSIWPTLTDKYLEMTIGLSDTDLIRWRTQFPFFGKTFFFFFQVFFPTPAFFWGVDPKSNFKKTFFPPKHVLFF